MNLLIGCLSIIIFLLLSNIFAEKYSIKKRILLDFNDFNTRLKNEVLFSHETLWSIASYLNNGEFKFCLENYLQNGQVEKIKYLDKNEQEFLENYLLNVGNKDAKTQINFINSVELTLKEFVENGINNERKYKTLYLKLGLLVGLIAFILLF